MKKTTKKTAVKSKPVKYATEADLNFLSKVLREQRAAFMQRLDDQVGAIQDLRQAESARQAILKRRSDQDHQVIRRLIACQVLNGMLSSPPLIDRAKVDKVRWVRIAYEWADELIRQS